MSRATTAQSSKLPFTLATSPNGQLIMTTQPIPGKKNNDLNPNAILLAARFIALCGADAARMKFSQSDKVLEGYAPWNNIFQFLFGKNFTVFVVDRYVSDKSLQLATFAATIARPSLLLANDSLAYAALNADLDLVKRIIENATPKQRMTMLSEVSTTTTQLGRATVTRTGTPLQMAIYTLDEEMVCFFREYMDPKEFKTQWEKVLGTNYQAFIDKQQSEALALFDALQVNLDKEKLKIRCDNYISNSDKIKITLNQEGVDDFKEKLEQYVKNTDVHNPFITLVAYKIYKLMGKVPGDGISDDLQRDKWFSGVIGITQSVMSARLLQYYAQGIQYLIENNITGERSFTCHNYNPALNTFPPPITSITKDIRDMIASGFLGQLKLGERFYALPARWENDGFSGNRPIEWPAKWGLEYYDNLVHKTTDKLKTINKEIFTQAQSQSQPAAAAAACSAYTHRT